MQMEVRHKGARSKATPKRVKRKPQPKSEKTKTAAAKAKAKRAVPRTKKGIESAKTEPSNIPKPNYGQRPGTKLAALVETLHRKEGASLEELVAQTGWLPHSVRGCMSGMIKKNMGLDVVFKKDAKRGPVYRIVDAQEGE